MFSCMGCGYTAARKRDLKHHMKRHANTPETPNLPPKVALHDLILNVISPSANDSLLEQLEQEEIKFMFDQNIHHGFGVTQNSSMDVTLPDEVCQ